MQASRVRWHADPVVKLRSELTKDRGPWPVTGWPVRHPTRVGQIALMIGVLIGIALPSSVRLLPVAFAFSFPLTKFVLDLVRDLRGSRQP